MKFLTKKNILVLVLLITSVSFSPTLRNQFTNWDDANHITANPDITGLDSAHFKKIFSRPIQDTYVPLTILSFALEYHFVQLNPFLYHLDNLLLHLGVTTLIFLFVLRLGFSLTTAGCTALLFGIHPLHVESVAWATERKDVLYAFFYMLAVYNYCGYLKTRRWQDFIGVLVLGLLSMLAKAMALSLPFILLLCDWFYERQDKQRVLLEKIPFLFYIVPIAWITYSLNMKILQLSTDVFQSILMCAWSFAFYLNKFIFPFVFIPIYSVPKPITIWNWSYAWAVIVVVGFVFCLIRYKEKRWLTLGSLFYFASIFFLLRFTENVSSRNFVADRFGYLPSFGFCLITAVLIEQITQNLKTRERQIQQAVLTFAGILIVFLSVKTFCQTQVWKNNLSLWNYAVSQNHSNDIFYYNRAASYFVDGKYDLAVADCSAAIELNPQKWSAYNVRALAYRAKGEYDLALKDFSVIESVSKNDVLFFNNRGITYMDKGDKDKALQDFNRALAINPRFPMARDNRELLLRNQTPPSSIK